MEYGSRPSQETLRSRSNSFITYSRAIMLPMPRTTTHRCLLILLALSVTAWCADYQVVLKSSGNVIHGAFLYEDANTITLQVNSAEVSFKKEKLDLARMKELNQSQLAPGPQQETGGAAPLEGQSLIC